MVILGMLKLVGASAEMFSFFNSIFLFIFNLISFLFFVFVVKTLVFPGKSSTFFQIPSR